MPTSCTLGAGALPSEQGPVSRKSRKRFGSEKPLVKLRTAYSVKLVFSYVIKGTQIKVSCRETSSFWRYKENYVTPNAPEHFRGFRETGPRCGSYGTGWLNGPHPKENEGTVTQKVCFNHLNSWCRVSKNIQVRNCGGYYVYYLKRTICHLRFCGTDRGGTGH